jgi:hypothetical protein
MRAQEEVVCKDLVLAKERLIQDYMRKTFHNVRREHSHTRAVSARAFQQGYMDAENVEIGANRDRERTAAEALTA